MGTLIEDILSLSRLGRQEMSFSKIDMKALTEEVWDELKKANPGRRVEFSVHSMPYGYGDRVLLKQMCTNILSNALKFTKLKETALIEAGGRSDGNANIYYVKDNGVGFDMQYHDKIFGIFHRLSHDEEFEGTGVGLAIVQRIIHRHEGKVWAEGKEGEGATFYFSLPLPRTLSRKDDMI